MAKRNFIKGLWAEHMRCEFELKDAEATMATMSKHPLINNIPTMVGGNGYEEVYSFYKNIFLPQIPQHTEITSIACIVDDQHLVDEQLFCFVHDNQLDFMLPNIAPTGKTIKVPLVVIVYIEDDKVAGEHIYWDQGTVLKQLGLLNDESLPIVGAEQAKKLLDRTVQSNHLLKE